MSYIENMFSLKGKTAIVTGGRRGIGEVVSEGLAQAGAEVIIFSKSDASAVSDKIVRDGGKAYSILVDVTDEKAVDAAVNEVLRRSAKVDLLFNNAGICIHKDTLEASIEEWRQVIEVNLTGEYIVACAVGRAMIESKKGGSIINMASMSGSAVNIPQWQASYNASKAGVIHMTRSLAMEWVDYGIRVNSLSPGYIGTPMSVDTPKELRDAWMPLIPMHRMADPQELMPAILYLFCDAAGYTTGTDTIVDGGYLCL